MTSVSHLCAGARPCLDRGQRGSGRGRRVLRRVLSVPSQHIWSFSSCSVWFGQLDDILHSDTTRVSSLHEGTIGFSVSGLTCVLILLGLVYGFCMGSYALIQHDGAGAYMQFIAGSIKIPALFFLTLLVTMPSLYVFNVLVRSRLTVVSVLWLLIVSLGVSWPCWRRWDPLSPSLPSVRPATRS